MLTLPGDASYTYTKTYNATTGLLDTLQYPVSTSSYQLKLQYAYTNGLLKSITDFNTPYTVFWTANSTNPRGQVTQETLGNGVIATHAYDAVTGWVGSIQAGVSGGSALQNFAYLFDEDGNVTQRQDNNLGLTENVYYDNMNRLWYSTLGGSTNLQMTYDTTGMGNITARSDVAGGATWTYDPVHKHQVTQAGSSAYTYTYDANGNAITRNGYSMGWTSYNYPSAISSSGETVDFWYGPFRQRWKTIYTGSIGTETTYHVDKLMEKVASGGTIYYRHYIFAGNEPVAVYNRASTGTNTLNYILADHQSSFANILTSAGATNVAEGFTAFGNRRSGTTWSGAPSSGDETAINAVSRWGYTGETVLGVSMGLNHLNGRVEDAITGRFLSPDPFIPDPRDTQSYNRYSYAENNPLTFIDPTGFDACKGEGCVKPTEPPPPPSYGDKKWDILAGGGSSEYTCYGACGYTYNVGHDNQAVNGTVTSTDTSTQVFYGSTQNTDTFLGSYHSTSGQYESADNPNCFGCDVGLSNSAIDLGSTGGGGLAVNDVGGRDGGARPGESPQGNPNNTPPSKPCDQPAGSTPPSSGNHLSTGVQFNMSTVVGSGTSSGVSSQSVPGSTTTDYSYNGPGVGFDPGLSLQSVWAYGNGSWTGLFQSVNFSAAIFAWSVFWTPGQGGWVGATFGFSAGPPGASFTETNYTCNNGP